ncbi:MULTISPECIES: MerR family transcriptional regulator [Paenibacillus]|jgi:MerR family transcriptional regulator, repressor of the yfmOP operon|uniref:MerR family transcriptional regulator n=1 Tax=Paenibacillus TaxID=44249 RepID=UPI0004F7BB4C|nr:MULTISPECIES: MerR family transcriptional regulator [unclassified Paenibacillus]AIQ33124.1 transcriptional regulator [Paenibacillus sp. FSL P4-0081]OMF28946.1 MerR family transcriptional regulator [Paenibacillus sp. FSL H8-0259]
MLTISQVSVQTGLTPYTIRYYEKIGVLHEPKRSSGGARVYKESEVSYIQCLNKLKKLGLSLEEITEFTREGCVMDKIQQGENPSNYNPTLKKRIEILEKHLMGLESRRQEIDYMISLAEEKLTLYQELTKEDIVNTR